jgi:hypothetical protein
VTADPDQSGQPPRFDGHVLHIAANGVVVKSKNEVIIAGILDDIAPGRWAYETPLKGADGRTAHPDFTIQADNFAQASSRGHDLVSQMLSRWAFLHDVAIVHAPAAFCRRGVYVSPRSWRSHDRGRPAPRPRSHPDAFRRLGDLLAHRGVVAGIYVIGGGAMTLAYDARRSIRDIDAVFQRHGAIRQHG